uniref:3'-5' exonuclease domain-containing protein n=4 Tax=Triticinae TaxID=1648030 RepID=A0A452ZFU1_AEGTS
PEWLRDGVRCVVSTDRRSAGAHMKRRTQEVHVAGRTAHATVTSHPAVARRWVHTTRWRNGGRLRSSAGLIVGMGVQWTPPFRRLPDGAEPRPATLQLCCGRRCLVFQIGKAGAGSVPLILQRFLEDARVDFFGYNVLSDCRKLSAHYGLRVACPRELRLVTGMGNASMESMAEQLLGWRGVKKSQRVGVSNWDVSTLSKRQVRYAASDALVSYCLGAKCLK